MSKKDDNIKMDLREIACEDVDLILSVHGIVQ